MAAKHILVGADFSEQSKRGTAAVGEYAKVNDSKVTSRGGVSLIRLQHGE